VVSKSGSELLSEKKQTILIIGPSGSGKTSLVGEGLSRTRFQDGYIFDTDYRLRSLLTRYGKGTLDHISFDQFREAGGATSVGFAAIQKKKQELYTTIRTAPNMLPRTVVVDSGTFLANLVMKETLLLDGKKPDATPGLNHYGTATTKFLSFVSEMTAGPWNFIMTVHDDVVKDDITGALKYGIALTRKLRSQLPGYFNEVWETAVRTKGKEISYEVHPKFYGGYPARTCISTLGSCESHQDLWDKIEKWCDMLDAQVALTGSNSVAKPS
jgi:GTPase SAR1 family protein